MLCPITFPGAGRSAASGRPCCSPTFVCDRVMRVSESRRPRLPRVGGILQTKPFSRFRSNHLDSHLRLLTALSIMFFHYIYRHVIYWPYYYCIFIYIYTHNIIHMFLHCTYIYLFYFTYLLILLYFFLKKKHTCGRAQ